MIKKVAMGLALAILLVRMDKHKKHKDENDDYGSVGE